ncbi:SUF system Fe-S cluster assembly protein [Xanthobacter sp. KR7-225]|uniref:SUF system Fe-S cluster assembly protein n=1 Tax=Xanthobacter sp. KR7-225 TaxID=3156613 RepID=UPI0032B3B61E
MSDTTTDTAHMPLISGALPDAEISRLTDEIVGALKSVYDPEIPVDIYELGLIYKVDIADDRTVAVEMTLTTPNCPAAAELPGMVESAVAAVPGVADVKVDITFDPPWDQGRMSEEARATLNLW